jgi:hypothetical protein
MIQVIQTEANPVVRPLLLCDVDWLQTFFCHLVKPLAEVNPTVLLAWRSAARLEYVIEDNVLYVLGDDDGGRVLWLPPLGVVKLSRAHIIRGLELVRRHQKGATVGVIHNVWEQYPLWRDLQRDPAFSIRADSTEYVYDTLAVANLSGTSFKTKRSDVRFFVEKYQPSVARYEPAAAPECLALMAIWLAQKLDRCDAQSAAKVEWEYEVCRAALSERLPVEGVICRVGARLVAFSLGVTHSATVFNCLFEKADLALRGCSAFIFSALARSLRGRYSYINAGDDWGLPELALAKRLWRPVITRQTYHLTTRSADESFAGYAAGSRFVQRESVGGSSCYHTRCFRDDVRSA